MRAKHGILVAALVALGCGDGRRASPAGADAAVDGQAQLPDAPGPFAQTDAQVCERLRVEASEQPPNVLIMADASGSMLGARWTSVRAAFENVVTNYQHRIAFGLYHYSSNNGCNDGVLDVAPKVGAASEIDTRMGEIKPLGGTPTAAAARAVRNELSNLAGTSYVLLVTDGAPNCNDRLDASTCECSIKNEQNCSTDRCLDDEEAVSAIAALRDANLPTFVIGFAVNEWADVLNRMASAGRPGSAYISVEDGASLEAAMVQIAGSVRSCVFELESVPSAIEYVNVTLNGAEVEHISQGDGTDGWDVDGNTLRLTGEPCQAVQSLPEAVTEIAVECEPVFVR